MYPPKQGYFQSKQFFECIWVPGIYLFHFGLNFLLEVPCAFLSKPVEKPKSWYRVFPLPVSQEAVVDSHDSIYIWVTKKIITQLEKQFAVLCQRLNLKGPDPGTSKFDIIIPLHSLNLGAQWRCRRWYPPWHRNARPLGRPRALPPCGSERDASGFRWQDEVTLRWPPPLVKQKMVGTDRSFGLDQVGSKRTTKLTNERVAISNQRFKWILKRTAPFICSWKSRMIPKTRLDLKLD